MGCTCRACFITLFVFSLGLFILNMTASSGLAASLPRMRPYTGIGLFVFTQPDSGTLPEGLQLQLYEEPGLQRVGRLNDARLTGNEWIFSFPEVASPLIVSARKGGWLRVTYDDAGREAWVEPENRGLFQSWEQFLKLQTGGMLPGLQPQYYQLQQQPGGKLLGTLTPKQVFKVLKLEDVWCMVLTDQEQIGWVRWCDDDGRLNVGVGRK